MTVDLAAPALFDVVVVGGGVMGRCIARCLSRSQSKGLGVCLVDAMYPVTSSKGEVRVTRLAYHDVLKVEMMQHCFRVWGELGEKMGQELLSWVGSLDLCTTSDLDISKGHVIHELVEVYEQMGLKYEYFRDAEQVRGGGGGHILFLLSSGPGSPCSRACRAQRWGCFKGRGRC